MAEILTEQIDALKEHRSPDQGGKDIRQKLPKGVVLDKDGKPCRTCTSLADWRALTRMKSSSTTANPGAAAALSSSSSSTLASKAAIPSTIAALALTSASASDTLEPIPSDCPADVEMLGRSTWTLLHTMAASYPTTANTQQQDDMRSFLSLFSKLYPCWVCADDFRAWMNDPSGKNKPKVKGRAEFGNWMCEAHNEVNRKLGKKVFDCAKWEERWRTGWKDGRCD
ncbi:Flavin-linked sulfhydryl oxidase of the mitochondrial IMS [Ophidiomyces ophidiicola]|uniref:Flavin-linked sulfhydryl oxidase of the mitochondrial IMS n=1 Tax=Ophidiomyces ophidiicola TaxID=1387563 RepID=A0ACB8UXF0_9EURO|nr:Flavin-linked sulfhydryl oxidase of the mitochondrial IMS [Ophidiomyces ophidiicola]KAI1972320.1 Flavin-linked sulfhydryl oxidase of the mitochondrial IMS [Ophidiomyces ophidiicola]KAI2005868.1 Flavin-linked sulfhydryl oxidase of the mitochondrial IMS [Ophidiomyces ophidiicola]KAI2032957.1 Flavin-linked sulfhydryl oxidase of the mitochondrial IMS [Ophidiomyces ophidiicola]KAI2038415.1 Flavin-linked sulfhydryl oxidase of the mitochondrial IMS [Ophidiomyces ophidiicola]